MVFKIIPDANILLDLMLKRSDDYEDLLRIYQSIVENRYHGFVTTSIVHTCGYWLSKAFTEMYAKQTLIGLLNDVRIIDAPHRIVEDALYSDMKDIEDALQYYTALHHKLDVFISRDKGFIKSSKPILPVLHPKDFIKRYIDN